MKHEWNRCSKTEGGSKLLVVTLVGTLQKNVVIHFSYGSAAACFIFEVTNLAFRRLGNGDADGCGPFPKDSRHESQIWKSERQCFDWGCQNKKLLTCFCIYELHDCCILNDVIVRLEELFLVTALGHSQKSHSAVWTWDYCSFEPLQFSPVLIAFADDLLLGFSRWLPPNSVEDTLPSRIREHRSWRVGWWLHSLVVLVTIDWWKSFQKKCKDTGMTHHDTYFGFFSEQIILTSATWCHPPGTTSPRYARDLWYKDKMRESVLKINFWLHLDEVLMHLHLLCGYAFWWYNMRAPKHMNNPM